MKRFAFAALALTACAPQPSPSSSSPDALGVRYEVRVGQALLPNVRSVSVSGPDIELVEFRQGGQPGAPTTLAPGRVGSIKLFMRTDWTAAEQTMEAWRASIAGGSQTVAPLRRNIVIAITSRSGGAPVSYTFQNCLPTEHQMLLGASDARIEQTWRATCERVTRS